MNYTKTKELFSAMDKLEIFSKMHREATLELDIKWDVVDGYSDVIQEARKEIFNLMEQSQ